MLRFGIVVLIYRSVVACSIAFANHRLYLGVQEVLEEIEEDRRRLKSENATEGPSEIAEDEEDAVLVTCKDERMCQQLQEVVHHGSQKVHLFSSFIPAVVHAVPLI